MVLAKASKLSAFCLVLAMMCPSGKCSDIIDYRKALDILISSQDQSKSRSLSGEFEFVSFMRDFNKVYGSQDELFERLTYFKNNLDTIDRMKSVNKGTAKYGITKFSDHSDEELQMYTGLRPSLPLTSLTHHFGTKDEARDGHDKAPASFDWRLRNVVTPVKNQLTCGSCWAFSAIGCVESHHAIKTNKLVALSEQKLLDCDKKNQGCHGGFMHDAFEFIMKSGGIESSSEYPYVAKVNPEWSQHCNKSQANQNSLVKVLSYRNITGGEDDMKQFLYRHGPLSIAFNANNIPFYQSGIVDYDELECDPLGVNHGLLLVGYGEERSPTDGRIIPYWIIKNSWGSSWGEQGYFRVRRGKNVCGVALLVTGVETN